MPDSRVSARQAGYSRAKCAEARGAIAAAKRRVAETILVVLVGLMVVVDVGGGRKLISLGVRRRVSLKNPNYTKSRSTWETAVTSPNILNGLFVV